MTVKSEFGQIDLRSTSVWHAPELELENGGVLKDVPVCHKTYGRLNADRSNVLFVCHPLTGHALLDAWWGGLLGSGPQYAFDTSRYFVVCANMLGSCYGTCGPTSVDPRRADGARYGKNFPVVTVRDTVRLHLGLLKDGLGIQGVVAAIGGSLGGMQALEWAFHGSSFVGGVVAMACSARQNPWQVGLNHVQREAIYADPRWNEGDYQNADPPVTGLSIARQLAMMSYRTPGAYAAKFGESRPMVGAVKSYLDHQGSKLVSRFDAMSYVRLTQMLDSHDVGRDRGGFEDALRSISQPALIIGIESDVLYPIEEQRELARLLPGSTFASIPSPEGHDGYLLEQERIGAEIQRFLGAKACGR